MSSANDRKAIECLNKFLEAARQIEDVDAKIALYAEQRRHAASLIIDTIYELRRMRQDELSEVLLRLAAENYGAELPEGDGSEVADA
jgi:hypothetical protein